MANAEDQVKPEDETRPEISDVEPVDQETQPTEPQEQRIPLQKHVELRKRAQKAERELEEREREIQALKNENDLKSLAIPEPKSDPEEEFIPIPDRYDFDNDEAWIEAQKEWNRKNNERLKKQVNTLAEEQAKSIYQQQEEERQKTEVQKQAEQEYQSKYKEMLERADKLNVDADEFMQAEESLKQVWKPWFYDSIIMQADNPEQVVMVLGKDPDKALELANTFDDYRQQGKDYLGFKTLFDFAGSLDPTQTRGDLPEPDEPVEGGAGSITSYEKELAKMREKHCKGEIGANEMIAWKEANPEPRGAA